MQGEIVIVRTCGDIPVVRRIFEVKNGLIYITTDEQLGLFMSGKKQILSVGVPAGDVYKYDQRTLKFIEKIGIKTGVDWEQLSKWTMFNGEAICSTQE
jgi:hypothetical protein